MAVAETVSTSTAQSSRWIQLLLGLIAMMAMSSPQYVWTLFVKPFQTATGGALPAIQITFSLLVVLQTWLSPLQGWLIERLGGRFLITLGCILSGLGWVLSAQITSVSGLYLTYGLFCGVGTGFVYIGIVGLMLKWFPDRRGLAVGVVAAGYGFGAIATTFPIDSMIRSAGYQSTLVTFGIILGGIGALAGLFMRQPPDTYVRIVPRAVASLVATAEVREVRPGEMLKTPIFWLLFVMMTMMSTGGLMVTSQFAPFMREFGVADVVIFGMAALPFALTLDRITNGLTRPFFGWVSDMIGRESTMLIAFALEAVAVFAMLGVRDNALLFALMSGVVFFGWGEIFSLFPSTLTDTFGAKNATTNYGFLYMAQGIGSVLGGPAAAALHDWTGSWVPVFYCVVAADALTAVLAFFVLKPMRRAYLARPAY
ncbi:MAG: major facilitator superfamily 1 [Rhodospirillales bacterium]|nr:major facilitator superfamily 1 [Rhodospirillales bacterium]